MKEKEMETQRISMTLSWLLNKLMVKTSVTGRKIKGFGVRRVAGGEG